jgi:hypothetical protein
MSTWIDDGIKPQVFVSTSGDFVSLGTRTEYPFTAGGSGIPSGWTQSIGNGLATDVNFTTASNRFSVSNATPTDSHRGGRYYGAYMDFPVQQNHRYMFQVQARTMDGKSSATRNVFLQLNGTGGNYMASTFPTGNEWEQISIPYQPTSGITFVRVTLQVNYYLYAGQTEVFDWGVQWQGMAVVDQLANYPDPTWKEITCDIYSLNARYGRSKFTSRYDVAQCSIGVRNDDGEFTYHEPHPWGLRPGRFIKVTVDVPSPYGDYQFFYGIIDSIVDTYTLAGRAVVVISAIDVSTLLSNINVPSVTSNNNTFLSGARFKLVYQAAGWLPQMARVDTGVYSQQTIQASGRSVRDELGLIADSEGGYFYTDRGGVLTYHDRNYPNVNPAWNTVQAELLAECASDLVVDNIKWVFPGVLGNYLVTPYDPSFTPQDINIAVRLKMNDISGSAQTFVAKGGSYWFRKQAGTKRLQFSPNAGAFTWYTSTADLPYNNGDTFWIKVTFSTISNALYFYHCPDTHNNTLPSSPNQILLGTGIATAGVLLSTTGMLATGGYRDIDGTLQLPLNATVYCVHIRSASTDFGTTIYRLDSNEYAGKAGVPSFTTTMGHQVTVNQTGNNVVMPADPDNPTTALVPVDNVPTKTDAPIIYLKDLQTDWSRDRIVNTLQVGNQGGSATDYVNAASQKKYGPYTYQRLDFVNDNAHPEYLDQRIKDLSDGLGEAIVRVNSVKFRPTKDNYWWALSAFLNDLVRVRYEHPSGWGFAVATHIQALDHALTLEGWETTLTLDQPISFNIWTTIEGTGWDVSIWDDSLWDGGMPAQWNRGSNWEDPNSVWGN